MPKKGAVKRKATRPKARKAAPVRSARPILPVNGPLDATELLLKHALAAPKTQSATGLHTLLYNSTPSMRNLAYRYGFTVGKLLQMQYVTIENLLTFLERSGLGSVLYTPSADVSHIHSTSKVRQPDIGSRAHHYECGVIAGYFSSYTNNTITTSELQCRLDKSNSCTFIAGAVVEQEPRPRANAAAVIHGLTEMMATTGAGDAHADPYTSLALDPLLNGGVAKGVSSLLYLAATRLPEPKSRPDEGRTLAGIGRFLGANAVFTKNTKAKKSVTITYTLYNSTSTYVELTLPAFTGYLCRSYRKSDMDIRRTANGAYAVSLELKPK